MNSIKDIKQRIKEDKEFYIPEKKVEKLFWYFIKPFSCHAYKAIKYNRLYCYYCNKNMLLKYFCRVRYDHYARRYNFDFLGTTFGRTPFVYHANLVINPHSYIGDNCVFHGSNIIGINKKNEPCPKIGNNVEFGINASAIGNIVIGDNVYVGAYSLVNTDIEKDCRIVGIPARKKI